MLWPVHWTKVWFLVCSGARGGLRPVKKDGGDNSVWLQGSKLLGEFWISLNPNFIQSNQNVWGRVCRTQWTLSGLVLIRGGAFEGCPDWSVIPPPLNMRDGYITRFSAVLHTNRLPILLYCSALLGWIGLGAVGSDRGRRYCVKGFGVRPYSRSLSVPLLYIYAGNECTGAG